MYISEAFCRTVVVTFGHIHTGHCIGISSIAGIQLFICLPGASDAHGMASGSLLWLSLQKLIQSNKVWFEMLCLFSFSLKAFFSSNRGLKTCAQLQRWGPAHPRSFTARSILSQVCMKNLLSQSWGWFQRYCVYYIYLIIVHLYLGNYTKLH